MEVREGEGIGWMGGDGVFLGFRSGGADKLWEVEERFLCYGGRGDKRNRIFAEITAFGIGGMMLLSQLCVGAGSGLIRVPFSTDGCVDSSISELFCYASMIYRKQLLSTLDASG